MIGMELLNLMQGGDPMQRAFSQLNPPNPNPGQAPPRPAGGPPAPNAMPGGGQQPQQPPGPPAPPSVAPQSPPDLAQLYMQMAQRERSANAIDHGLALMASAYAAPGTQGQIMHSMDNQNPDPATQLSNMVALENMQRLNAARPALIASLSGGASGQGGMDPALLAGLPTDQLQKIITDRATTQIALQNKGAETKQADLLEAQQKAPAALQQMNDMDQVANQLKGPMNPALTSIIASPTARIAAEKLLETDPKLEPGDAMRQVYAGMLNSDQLAALNQLKKLDAQVYSDAFQSTGSRRTQQEVASLKTGLSPLKNFNQSPEAYMSQFNDFQKQLHTTIANTYGSAGRLDEIPDTMKWDTSDPNNPKPLVDSAYLPNGNKYAGGGGQWASNPPKSSFDYASIPSGTVYTAPDGTQRRKP